MLAQKRRTPGQQIEQDCAETINVSRQSKPGCRSFGLLGCNVTRCSEDCECACEIGTCVEPLGQSEVSDEWFATSVEQNVSRFEIAMQNPVLMRVLHGACYLGHEPDALARFGAQRSSGFLQAAARRVFHAEKRQPVFALADFINGKNIRMIETGSGFRLSPKTFSRLARISVVRHHSLERDDPA